MTIQQIETENQDINEFKNPSCEMYQIIFDLIPAGDMETSIIQPYDYLFRGVIMDWISVINENLGDELHRTDKKGQAKVLREYSIYHETLKPGNHKNRQGIYQGVRFYLNISRSDMTTAILDYLMKQETSTIQLGVQRCIVTKIQIERKDLNKLVEESKQIKPIKSITLNFISPTAFKQINSDRFVHSPQPDKIYGNIMKSWNLVASGTKNQCPKELFNWIQENIEITEVNTKVILWEMGKGSNKFKGFIGRVIMEIKEHNKEFEPWLYVLTKFGTLASTGAQRSAGFGHYRIEKIRFLNV